MPDPNIFEAAARLAKALAKEDDRHARRRAEILAAADPEARRLVEQTEADNAD